MKLDPNSKEELPAVVRVAAKHPEWMTNPYLALQHAVSLIHAYNEGQDDEETIKAREEGWQPDEASIKLSCRKGKILEQ